MKDLEFKVYSVPSEIGEWLAVFEAKELIFLASYNPGKKIVEAELSEFLHKHYHFHIGKFETAKWSKGNFWRTKHQIKLQGTEFQMKVWLKLLEIPHGKTVTYSDIAKKIKQPTAIRAVATAIAQNPVCVWVPCHRVIGKNGNILKYRGGANTKRGLLISEGVIAS